MSIRTFLVSAKKHLQHAIHNNGSASFVIGNESADLDSIACALVYGYIQSSTLQASRTNTLTIPVTNIPASDLALRPELTALLSHADVKPSDLITLDDLGKLPLPLKQTRWTLVDHNALLGELRHHYAQEVCGVIDHHDEEHKVPEDAQPRVVEKSGSCCSLVTNHCRDDWDATSSASSSVGAANGQDQGIVDDAAYTSTWDAQVAKLALGAVLIDTVNMTEDSKVTEHDKKAVRYLEARINASTKIRKDYDRGSFYQEISAAKGDIDGLSLKDILRKDYKQWIEGDLTLGISCVVKPVAYLQDKGADFMDTIMRFAEERGLQLFAVMTAYETESGDFARQLMLVATAEGKASAAAQGFARVATEELRLENAKLESGADSATHVPYVQLWNQKNLAASRKRVGPLLREAMR